MVNGFYGNNYKLTIIFLGANSKDGLVELVDAGINIFEIKKKEPKPAPESTAA